MRAVRTWAHVSSFLSFKKKLHRQTTLGTESSSAMATRTWAWVQKGPKPKLKFFFFVYLKLQCLARTHKGPYAMLLWSWDQSLVHTMVFMPCYSGLETMVLDPHRPYAMLLWSWDQSLRPTGVLTLSQGVET
jgi:hypothetical protein